MSLSFTVFLKECNTYKYSQFSIETPFLTSYFGKLEGENKIFNLHLCYVDCYQSIEFSMKMSYYYL